MGKSLESGVWGLGSCGAGAAGGTDAFRRASLFFLLLILSVCFPLHASEPAPADARRQTPDARLSVADARLSVELSALPTNPNVGDDVAVTIVYRWAKGLTPTTAHGEPDPSVDFHEQFVTSLPPARTVSTGDEERRIFTVTVSALASGAWAMPPVTFSVRDAQGHEYSATASPLIVQVGSEAKPADLPAPRPRWTKTMTDEPHGLRTWMLAALGAILAGAISIVLLWRKRLIAAAITPWQILSRDMAVLSSISDGKEAGALLSLALRRYAGAVYGFDALAATARETARHLRGRGVDDEARMLVRLLDDLDALRWAPHALAADTVRPLTQDALAWATSVQRRLDAEAAAEKERKTTRAGAHHTTAPAPGTSASAAERIRP